MVYLWSCCYPGEVDTALELGGTIPSTHAVARAARRYRVAEFRVFEI